MEIETDTADIEPRDSIVVETQENGNDVIYSGRINSVDDDTLEVAFDVNSDSYTVISTDENNKWVQRFGISNYGFFMRAEVKDNGTINISGL